MHDARWFEAAGRPSVALVSGEFQNQARYQAKILDAVNVPQVFVDHPISDQSTSQLYAKAEAIFEEIVTCLTKAWSPVDIDDVVEEPVEDCAT